MPHQDAQSGRISDGHVKYEFSKFVQYRHLMTSLAESSLGKRQYGGFYFRVLTEIPDPNVIAIACSEQHRVVRKYN
ncbi:unnamed protein product [Clonostachys byssicola]|uniref:Uncharacterized protein n=1 Tax=Clonostachys byssicola TaxID=160290 RepID=A0A9N9Y5W4_9HYPO|nr:unnamed protein product [Clonostachys byssicola]